MNKALAVAVKEMHQIARDRRTLLILLLVPALFLLLFGYALNFDIRNIRLAIDDRDRTAQSRALVAAFVNSGYFELVAVVRSTGEIDRLMDADAIRAALVLPRGLGRDLQAGRPAQVQVLVNGENATTAATVISYAQSIVRSASLRYEARRRGGQAPVPVVLAPRVWYNPELRSTLFLVPGLIAYIAMITAVVSTALSIVREKERGTMEQVRMAPLSPLAFILGKTLPYFVISLASSLLILLSAMVLYDLPMRGSWGLLLLSMSLFLVGALALGLFVSTVADSQQVAFQVALLTSFLPTAILSGFIFPIASMPTAVQLVTYLVPARYFLEALRGVVLKDAGIAALAPPLAALTIFAAAVLALSAVRLRREWA